MPLTLVAQTAYPASAASTTRTVTVPAGVQDGDMIHVLVTKAGGANDATLSGGSGYVAAPALSGSGISTGYWYKRNATAADAGTTLTVVTETAVRATTFIIVTRGQAADVVPEISKTITGVSLSRQLPTVAAKDAVGFLAFLGFTGDASTVTAVSSNPPLTKVAEAFDPLATSGVGRASGAVFIAPGPITPGANYGGQTLTIEMPTSTSPTSGAWLIGLALAPAATVDTVYPSSTVSNSGFTAVGASTVHAALADSLDTTYIESGDNPNGATVTVAHPVLGPGGITVRTKNRATAATPQISRQISLLQGATVVASRVVVLPQVAQVHTWKLTEEEEGLVTDRSALRLRITDTVI